MNLKISDQVLTWGVRVFGVGMLTTFVTTTFLNQPSLARDVTFLCDMGTSEGQSVPTTFVFTQDGRKLPVIYWVSDYFSGLTPQQRCQQVTYRFQRSYDNGNLNNITTGIVNRLPVVCATTRKNAACTSENLLFTLKRGSDPNATLRQIFNRRALANGRAVRARPKPTVTRSVISRERSEERVNIDFKAFLTNAEPENE